METKLELQEREIGSCTGAIGDRREIGDCMGGEEAMDIEVKTRVKLGCTGGYLR